MEEDSRLVERFKSGEQGAFDELVKRHYQRVCNIIFHTVGSALSVEDLAQEVFIKAYNALPRYRAESAFSTWIFRIAVNVSLDELRRHKRRHLFSFIRPGESETSRPEFEQGAPSPDQPDSALEEKELAEVLQAAMTTLPDKHRVVFTLRDVEGFSYQEIAKILRCSIGTVKSRLFYARAKLRDHLRSYLRYSS